ncbi:MAG TPA: ribbon-helix-helix protein, CopG family [Steroidobacteraceae bacterium]|nr:ribbon-helix-helix protein, CopG family [Steroidobacteraceae bacterium]
MGRTLRTQVALYLDDEYVELLARLARKTGRTRQDLLREAILTLFAEYGLMQEARKARRKP